MKILLIEYRDMKHPEAGGAEIVLLEVFRRIVTLGHQVDYLCNGFDGGAREEFQEGIRIIRRGRQSYFNYLVPWVYRRELRANRYDLIIEGLDKIPFYMPLFERKVPVMAIVPHLFGSAVFREAWWPAATYVYLLERGVPRLYPRSLFSLLCQSTKEELVERGMPESHGRVIHPGFTHSDYPAPEVKPPRTRPTLLYVGRVKKYKGVEQGVLAVQALRERYPDILYRIVGGGDYHGAIRDMTRKLGLEAHVEMCGRVSHADKVRYLQEADVLLYCSPKEGWGLSVIEANSCGTVVVASNSPGLREAVRHDETGFLVPHQDAAALSARVDELLRDPALYARMRAAAIAWSKTFTWEKAAGETLALAEEAVRGR